MVKGHKHLVLIAHLAQLPLAGSFIARLDFIKVSVLMTCNDFSKLIYLNCRDLSPPHSTAMTALFNKLRNTLY